MPLSSTVPATKGSGAPFTPTARNPRALLKINDIIVRQIESIEYVENNYYQPDSFRVRLPLYGRSDSIDIEYWLSQPAILVEILIGFPVNPDNYSVGELQSLVIGGINDLGIRPFDNGGGFIDFNGFDLSKKFIDNKTYEKYPNRTSSDIAIALAKTRGLTPVVTPTTTEAEIYYHHDFVQNGNAITEWDLLTYLAQREGFQVFVRGTSLYFKPRPITSNDPYMFQGNLPKNGVGASFNVSRMVISRNLNYAQDVIVNVISHNALTGPISVQARGSHTKRNVVAASAHVIGQPQIFTYNIPGLSKQQATVRAQQILEEISQHERVIEVTCPADNVLHKDSVILIKGATAAADQTYFPDTITRRISAMEGGYIMDVRAKNHSPQSVVTI